MRNSLGFGPTACYVLPRGCVVERTFVWLPAALAPDEQALCIRARQQRGDGLSHDDLSAAHLARSWAGPRPSRTSFSSLRHDSSRYQSGLETASSACPCGPRDQRARREPHRYHRRRCSLSRSLSRLLHASTGRGPARSDAPLPCRVDRHSLCGPSPRPYRACRWCRLLPACQRPPLARHVALLPPTAARAPAPDWKHGRRPRRWLA